MLHVVGRGLVGLGMGANIARNYRAEHANLDYNDRLYNAVFKAWQAGSIAMGMRLAGLISPSSSMAVSLLNWTTHLGLAYLRHELTSFPRVASTVHFVHSHVSKVYYVGMIGLGLFFACSGVPAAPLGAGLLSGAIYGALSEADYLSPSIDRILQVAIPVLGFCGSLFMPMSFAFRAYFFASAVAATTQQLAPSAIPFLQGYVEGIFLPRSA